VSVGKIRFEDRYCQVGCTAVGPAACSRQQPFGRLRHGADAPEVVGGWIRRVREQNRATRAGRIGDLRHPIGRRQIERAVQRVICSDQAHKGELRFAGAGQLDGNSIKASSRVGSWQNFLGQVGGNGEAGDGSAVAQLALGIVAHPPEAAIALYEHAEILPGSNFGHGLCPAGECGQQQESQQEDVRPRFSGFHCPGGLGVELGFASSFFRITDAANGRTDSPLAD